MEEVISVGILRQFSACKVCKKELKESQIRTKAFSCYTCLTSYHIDKLTKSFVIDFTIQTKDGEMKMHLSENVARIMFGDVPAQEVADEVFEIAGKEVKYDQTNNNIEGLL